MRRLTDFRQAARRKAGQTVTIMATEVFQVRTAKSRVHEYEQYGHEHESDNLLVRCAEANECRDLEDFLKLGIDAYDWIERADLWLRGAVASGALPSDEENSVIAAIDTLCRGWLRPCNFARAWIARIQGKGFKIDNVDRFHECCRQMESIVDSLAEDAHVMSDALIDMETAALKEHRNGETAEFFPEE